MVIGPEKKQLLLFGIPIAPDAAEHACAIIKCMRKNANFSFAVGNDAAFEKGKRLKRPER